MLQFFIIYFYEKYFFIIYIHIISVSINISITRFYMYGYFDIKYVLNKFGEKIKLVEYNSQCASNHKLKTHLS